ncbi:hypothetical protein [Piscibacillus halophilus]|uniref:Uncharacterized protein n=1 Tax=Piscibacillus halophilus TaxID=571933 RepID=A0A1H9L334_9BACI|nr:hypothetical protein [Piscibacillus halophilus]SER05718.1 hypothetical protein SAMN05216362_14319 [Piscibacillus halophilus]
MDVVLFSAIVLVLNLILIMFFIRPTGKQMESMITTMVLTSSFGLSIGFMMWFIFNHALTATLLSISTAAFLGMVIGGKFGVKCQIEGFFSGLMASMMGIMLIMMFNLPDGQFLLMVGLAFLCCITIFSIARQHNLNYKLLLLLCITVTFVFIMFSKVEETEHRQHHLHETLNHLYNY